MAVPGWSFLKGLGFDLISSPLNQIWRDKKGRGRVRGDHLPLFGLDYYNQVKGEYFGS